MTSGISLSVSCPECDMDISILYEDCTKAVEEGKSITELCGCGHKFVVQLTKLQKMKLRYDRIIELGYGDKLYKHISRLTLNEIQEMVFIEYKKNGYYDMWELKALRMFFGVHGNPEWVEQIQNMADVGEAGLINTEVSELLEIIRKQDKIVNEAIANDIIPIPSPKKMMGLECADIVIRVLNFCSRKNINVCDYIMMKHEVNMKRKTLHGNLV